MLYEFELSHNEAEAINNICCVKREGTHDHSTPTRWFKKFHLGWKTSLIRQDQVGLKLDFEAILKATDANPASFASQSPV